MSAKRYLPLLGVLAMSAFNGCDPGIGNQDTGPGSVNNYKPPETPTLEAEPLVTGDASLDDLEDGDLNLLLPDGSGRWQGATGTEVSVETGGADDTSKALKATTTSAGLSFLALLTPEGISNLRPHDYSSCSGVSLWVKVPDGTPQTQVTLDVSSLVGSGTATFDATSTWKQLTLDWADLPATEIPDSTGGAGAAGAGTHPGPSLNTSQITSLRVSASTSELWVDQVALTDCSFPNINPPLPKPPKLGSNAPADTPVALHGQLRVEGTQLVDQNGDPIVLKGVSSMWLEMENNGFAVSKTGLQSLRDEAGLNVFRASMGVAKGTGYLADSTRYGDMVDQIIQNAIDLGIYVLVDFHGHTASDFLPESRAFFAHVAETFGDAPNVLYEPFNEPLQVSWTDVLKPYHTSVLATIRARDPDNIVIFGTPNWSQYVDEAAQDPIGGTNVMYTLHFYTCSHKQWLRDRAEKAMGLGAPLFVTEFGLATADGISHPETCTADDEAWLTWIAEQKISAVAWKLDNTGDYTCLLSTKATSAGPWTGDSLSEYGQRISDWMQTP